MTQTELTEQRGGHRADEPARQDAAVQYGSDVIVRTLRRAGIRHIAFNPGATLTGVHESIVHLNEVGEGDAPLLCNHEAIAVGVAHGYAKASGSVMAVGIHSVVGVANAALAVFNAWADRAPVVLIAGTGPMRQEARRPRIDWIHTAHLQSGVISDSLKWHTQVFGTASIESSITAAVDIAASRPHGPTYVGFDVEDQEAVVEAAVAAAAPAARTSAASAPDDDLAELARLLGDAHAPVIVVDLYNQAASAESLPQRLERFARRWGAAVIDIGGRFNMPTQSDLALTDARFDLLRLADLVLAIDVRDLYGVLRTAGERLERGPHERIIADDCLVVSVTEEVRPNGAWVTEAAPERPDWSIPVPGHRLVQQMERYSPSTSAAAARVDARLAAHADRRRELRESWAEQVRGERDASPIATSRLCAELGAALGHDRWIASIPGFMRWPARLWDFDGDHLTHIGRSGGEGLGYGLPAAVGAAIAAKETGRFAVSLQGDGDLLFLPSAMWTAVAHELPLLIVVHNNRSYHQDGAHQGAMSGERGRGDSSTRVGIALDGNVVDFRSIARGYGVWAEEAVVDPDEVGPALRRAIDHIRRTGMPALVDVVSANR